MLIRIAVVAEAEADRRQVCELIDRKILDHAPEEWTPVDLDDRREYCGLVRGTLFTRWSELPNLRLSKGGLGRSSYIGKFGLGRKGDFDYPLGRKALLECVEAKIDVIVLIRDMDQQPDERTASLMDARDDVKGSLTVILALPTAKREAWVLNGFEPKNRAEEKRLKEERARLKFDPCKSAERLRAAKKGVDRDAKRVLNYLTNDDHGREAHCWRETAWSVLRTHGVGSGLTQFLAEVKERLVPLVTGKPV
jgi:hypothetical protein